MKSTDDFSDDFLMISHYTKEAIIYNHQINAFHCQQRWMEHTGKSLKNALHVLWYAKRHLSGWSGITSNSEKIKLVALAIIKLKASGSYSVSQSVSQVSQSIENSIK